MFNVSDFTNVIKFVLNRSNDEFFDMYKSIGFISEYYANNNFEKARTNFANWWCELDESTQTNIILYVKHFYER